MSTPRRSLPRARGAAGPLLFVDGSPGVALGEWVTIQVQGQRARRAQVIEAGAAVTVLQVLDETLGLPPGAARVTLTGDVARAVVGRELLGRALTGSGEPIDGLPAPVGEAIRPMAGGAINPVRRVPPRRFIETGISAIDGLNTLVRGQKLPVFSGPGLPGLDVAARIVEWARAPAGEAFAVIFVGLGITERETRVFLDRFERSGALERSTLYLNQTRDPTMERLLAPRLALTQAEFLAFERGYHVLVVLADILHYCDALREIAAAREEVPGRQGYPGYMYTDLAAIFERAGVLERDGGSVTQIPILTMPDDDITHPIPDLTGYITEGQLVLSRELHRAGVFPPIDVLPSLSRLMNSAIRYGTVAGHREWANQLYATYARGRESRLTAAILGEAGLQEPDRRALGFASRFEREFIGQSHRRTLEETVQDGWRLLETLPRSDLTRVSEATWERRNSGGRDL
jgi:V/A-type H+/Na+-transporting ATPase subunit B